MNKISIKPEVKAYGLVRNKEGKPQIEDIKTCPEEILSMLTDKERKELKV